MALWRFSWAKTAIAPVLLFVSLLGFGLASVPRGGDGKASGGTGSPSPPFLESLDFGESRAALAGAANPDTIAWVLRAGLVGITHEHCTAAIEVTPSLADRRLYELKLEMYARGGLATTSLRDVLDDAIGLLESLGYRNYSARQSRDGLRLSYRAVLLKVPAER